MARVGGIVSPQAGALYDVGRYIPYTINGGLAAISALFILCLHDTYSQDLQDNLPEEVNAKYVMFLKGTIRRYIFIEISFHEIRKCL